MVALGLVLVIIALALALAEAHLSTGGVIATIASVALLSGVVLMLIGAAAGWLAVVLVAAAICSASAAAVMLLTRSVRSVRRARPRAGIDAMVGHLGVVHVDQSGVRVFVDGGLWRAQPGPLELSSALHDGDRVVIEHVDGLTLSVRKADELELNR